MGTPIIKAISPFSSSPGRSVELTGLNLDGYVELAFLNGPQSGVTIAFDNKSSRSFVFQSPTITEGRYDLEVSVDAVTVDNTLLFQTGPTGLENIKICPTVHTEEDYACAAQEYLPPGPAWTRAIATYLYTIFLACGAGLQRFSESICNLFREITPQFADESLDDWEEELGLPGECTGVLPPTTTEGRRAEVVRKYNATGGSSKQYFIDIAASIGIEIVIEETAEKFGNPFVMGSTMGESFYGGPWLFSWFIQILDGTITEDERAELECFFQSIRPANTILNIKFVSEFIFDDGSGNTFVAEDGSGDTFITE